MVQDVSPLPMEGAREGGGGAFRRQPGAFTGAVRESLGTALQSALWFGVGIALMLAVWCLVCATFARALPTPVMTFKALGALMSHPFYHDSDGTMGVGNLILASLGRVFLGFGIGTLIAIPAGILMGTSPRFKKIVEPISQLMRPVSPLAWFPLSQVLFRGLGDGTTPAAIVGTIAITSLWPTLLNTAFGVSSLPEDYRTVARVFQFSRSRYLSKILLPYSLPHIVTGLRLSMGIAWLVIVAAEMLSGSAGIGFSAYDAYNNGRLDEMVATVILIGVVGLVLDRGFDWLLSRFNYEGKKA